MNENISGHPHHHHNEPFTRPAVVVPGPRDMCLCKCSSLIDIVLKTELLRSTTVSLFIRFIQHMFCVQSIRTVKIILI